MRRFLKGFVDMINPNEFMTIRNQAKELKHQNNWQDAIILYEKIYSSNCDRWIAWEYADCLKKLSRLDESIDVSKALFQRERNFLHNNNFLSWVLYEKYFKRIKDNYSYQELTHLYNIALSVSTFTDHDSKSAYEKILVQMLKILKNHGNNPAEKMLNLLEKLDVEKLSEEAGKYKRNGREQEYQSQKEMYYSLKTKALFDCKNYEDCIVCCDEALSRFTQFHHDNKTWLIARKAMCLAKTGDTNTAISDLKDAIVHRNHWSLFEKIAKIYLIKDDNNKAFLYYCRAAITIDPPKMKVSLYFDMAKLLLSMGDTENAWKHLCFAKSVREKEGWTIPNEMELLYNQFSPHNWHNEIKSHQLKDFWLNTIYQSIGQHFGIVSKMNIGGKSGFIESEKRSYFFKTSAIIGKPYINAKDRVSFCIIDSYDAKKKQKSIECGYIKIDKN